MPVRFDLGPHEVDMGRKFLTDYIHENYLLIHQEILQLGGSNIDGYAPIVFEKGASVDSLELSLLCAFTYQMLTSKEDRVVPHLELTKGYDPVEAHTKIGIFIEKFNEYLEISKLSASITCLSESFLIVNNAIGAIKSDSINGIFDNGDTINLIFYRNAYDKNALLASMRDYQNSTNNMFKTKFILLSY